MAYIPSSGSVAAWLQSDVASVITRWQDSSVISVPVGSTIAAVQGSVAVAIVSGSVTVATGNSSVMLLNSTNAIGSVTILQGTNPFIITGSIQGGGAGTQYIENAITPSVTGNAIMFKSNTSTSIVSVVTPSTPLPIQGSVSGTVNLGLGTTTIGSIVLAGGVNAVGSVATLQGTNPWVVAHPGGSVTAVRTDNASVILGTGTLQIGSVVLSGGVNAIGSVATLQGTNPWITVAPAGSVEAIRTDNASVIVKLQDSSILAVPVGSVIVVLQSSSIIATGPNASSIYGMRNDTVASFLGADLTIRPMVVDSAGRQIIKPFSSEDGTIISYVGSIVSGSVQLIQASAVGKKSYVTDFWLSNTGASNTLVTLQDGSTSIMGQFIAPTLGGMSSPGIAIPLKTNVSQDLAFKVSPSTSVLYLTLKGYVAP